MKRWKIYCCGLVVLAGLTPSVWAQPPAVPAVPTVAAPAGPPQPTFLNAFGLGPDQIAACKAKLCDSCIGKLISQMTMFPSVLSGGCIPPCCPGGPSPADMAKGGALGAAAKIAAEEAECPKKIQAVRFLARHNCDYYPEAKAALISALVADRCECVRYEAALALGTGCCCNRDTIEALASVVAGRSIGGNPPEISQRVRTAARRALEHCLACVGAPSAGPAERPPEVPGEKPKEKSGETGTGSVTQGQVPGQLTTYGKKGREKSLEEVKTEARRVLSQPYYGPEVGTVSQSHGLFDILRNASEARVSSRGITNGPVPVDTMPVDTVSPPEAVPSSIASTPVPAAAPPAALAIYPKQETSGTPGAITSYTIYPMAAPPAVAPTPKVELAPSVPSTPATPPVMPKVENLSPSVTPAAPPVMPKVENLSPASGTQSRAPAATGSYASHVLIEPKVENLSPASGTQSRTPATTGTYASHVHFEEAHAPLAQSGLPTQFTQQQLLLILRNSAYPWQREWAVDNLATTDWRTNPHVLQELVTAAQKDTAPSVRICCIRCLAKMNVQGGQLMGVFQTLKQDSDPRVRHEAEQALVGLRQARSSSPALSFAPVGN